MVDNDNLKTLTRADLTESVYKEIGFSYSESSELVDAVLGEIIDCLEEGNNVKLSSFGCFEVRKKQQRIGRNPKTKKSAVITARQVVTFHASNMLKKAINHSFKQEGKVTKTTIKSPVASKLKVASKAS